VLYFVTGFFVQIRVVLLGFCYFMSGTKDNSITRLIVAIGGTLLLVSVLCNLAFAWRQVSLQRQIVTSMTKLQQLSAAQQQINQTVNVIAQDLVSKAPQHPWLVPILQKYGLVRGAQPTPAPTTPSTSKKSQ